jgi:hypothetical protein
MAIDFVQCWGCSIFDRLFQILSRATAAVYDQMVVWAWVVLIAFWGFYAIWVVWSNLRSGKDLTFKESIQPTLINSLVVCVLLGMGIAFPKFITTITFEPVAVVANGYSQMLLQTNPAEVEKRVSYKPQAMSDDGMFRPALRDNVIDIMRTQITQFQSMIALGLAVMDNAFDWRAVWPIGNLLKHILMFVMGAYLVYAFFRLFMRFCFYFVDVIVNLAMFAFFFPFMLVLFVFKHASGASKWVQGMGDAFSGNVKNVFNSIVALCVAVLTYTVIMAIIAKFFAMDAAASGVLMRHILDGTVSGADLADENMVNLTLGGCIVIGYLVNVLQKQIPDITKEIWKAFGVDPAAPMGEEIANIVEGAVKNVIGGAVNKAKIVLDIGEKKEEKKEGEKPQAADENK